jgi:dTMP kinase
VDATTQSSESPSLLSTPQARKFAAAQFVSSLGDWIGLIAILSLSFRLARGTPFEVYGPGLVLITRTMPGFLFGQLAGPLVDRWDRSKVLAFCDVMRGLLIATLPFLPNLGLLILNQLVFELVTMMWQPAKEASVPDVVPKDRISQMNSISQIAAYGTFPLGALAFSGIAQLAQILGRIPAFQIFEINQESLALFMDSATFFVSAYLLGSLHLKRHYTPKRPLDLTLALRETRDGYRAIAQNVRVRTVIAGMSAAIFGAGAVISLGPLHVRNDLSGGASGFGVLVTALGLGAAIGVIAMETAGRKLARGTLYPLALVTAGASLILGAVVTTLPAASAFMFAVGLSAAPAYIAGLTIVHQETEATYRGRSFAALLSLTRLAMMIALGAAPLVAGALGSLTESLLPGQRLSIAGLGIVLSGTRMALLLGGVVVAVSGVSTAAVFHGGTKEKEPAIAAAGSDSHERLAPGARPELAHPRVSVSDVDPFHVTVSSKHLGVAADEDPSEGVREESDAEDPSTPRRAGST